MSNICVRRFATSKRRTHPAPTQSNNEKVFGFVRKCSELFTPRLLWRSAPASLTIQRNSNLASHPTHRSTPHAGGKAPAPPRVSPPGTTLQKNKAAGRLARPRSEERRVG